MSTSPDPAPSVSAVIPAHNAARFIREAIESARAQTVSLREIIVVDDGSTDGTGEIAGAYGPPVILIRQRRAGVAAARNRGLAAASAEHVAFLDADDVWLPDKLARQLSALRQDSAGASTCGLLRADAALRVKGEERGRIEGGLGGLLSFRYAGVSGSTLLASRALLQRIGGFDERLSTSADWDLLARLLLEGPVAVVEEPLLLYREHGANMHRNVAAMERDMLLAFERVFADDRLHPELKAEERRLRAILHTVLAGSYYETGRSGAAVRHGLRALLLDPRRLPRLVQGLLQGAQRKAAASPLRALYISYDGLLEPLGQSQVLPYVEGLSRRGVAVALLTFEKPEDIRPGSEAWRRARERLAAAGIRWVPLRYHKRPILLATLYDIARGVLRALSFARRHRAQVLHVRSYVSALMALPARWVLRCPLLFDIRGFWVDERVEGGIWRRGLFYRVAKWVERLLYRNADAVVSLTEAGKQRIEALPAIRSRAVSVTVIPTCVDTDDFMPQSPDPRLIDQLGWRGRTVFTYVGSIGTWYAMAELLDFFQVLLEVVPRAAFLLIVREPVGMLCEAVERKGLTTVTSLVPSVPFEDVPRWLSISHVGVAFYRPGIANVARFPTKVGEYLAAGLPVVISSGVGDCDRMLEGERVGVSVREFSVPEYRRVAKAVQALLEDAALSTRCRRVARERLSVEEGVKRYYSIYCALAVGSQRDGW